MRTFSVVSDAVRDTPYAVVISDNDNVTFHGLHQHGREWAAIASKALANGDAVIYPDGVTRSRSTEMSETLFKTFFQPNQPTGEYVPESNGIVDGLRRLSLNHKSFHGRTYAQQTGKSNIDQIMDVPIRHVGPGQRKSAVAYKARTFKLDARISSCIGEIKQNKYGFNPDSNVFKQRFPSTASEYASTAMMDAGGQGPMRRFGRSADEQTKMCASGRRAARHAKILSRHGGYQSEESGLRKRKVRAMQKRLRKL